MNPETVAETVRQTLQEMKAEDAAAGERRGRPNSQQYLDSFDQVTVAVTAENQVTGTIPWDSIAWAILVKDAMDRAARTLGLSADVDCTIPQVWTMTWAFSSMPSGMVHD